LLLYCGLEHTKSTIKLMLKQLAMKIKTIRNEKEYDRACARIYELMHSADTLIEPQSPEGEEIEILSLLINQWEQQQLTVSPPDPVEAIKFRIDQLGLKQVDIAPLFGGPTRLSEILHKKRPLTLRMIYLLNRYLDIPFESLISGSKRYSLNKSKFDELMRVKAIKEINQKKKRELV
jgi:HTH-type transcriptional regulator / antitoxin HigA